MKYFAGFLLAVLSVVPFGANCANIPTTRGNNLTAYNGASGTTNNNNWNALMNVRSGADSADMPVADFGNCNAIVLRCAQPKCANGGCVDVDVTSTIVAGCVRSNDACAKYGDDLVAYISAQLVAQSTAKSNAAQSAAANAAAAQSAQQMAAMQQQMQQMQSQMAAQNAATVAQLQDALEEQKQLTAQAIADATAARTTQTSVNVAKSNDSSNTTQTAAQAAAAGALTTAQQLAAQSGVSADILAREQISGQIMSEIENAQTQLNKLKETMTNVFNYAGCDSRGDNCTGPKRVKTFKQKAMDFFEPYDNVLGDVYDALILAQSVGVDITDIYMMLNDSCNVWGKYMCEKDQTLRYTTLNCQKDASGVYSSVSVGSVLGGANCVIGKIIPQSDGGCQPLGLINNDEEVRYNWLNPDTGEETNIKVGCMSDMLDTSALFRNRKKGASIDIETLKRIIEQDAPSVFGSRFGGKGTTTAPDPDGIKYCKVNPDTFIELEKIVSLKTLPQNVCVTDAFLKSEAENKEGLGNNEAKTRREIEKENCLKVNGASWDEEFGCMMIASVAVANKGTTTQQPYKTAAQLKCEASIVAHWDNYRCVCNNSEYNWNGETCVMPTFNTAATMCRIYGAIPSSNNSNICDCTNATNKSGCLAYNSRTILNK